MRKIFCFIACILICALSAGCSKNSAPAFSLPYAEQILTDYNRHYPDTAYANFTEIIIESEVINDGIYLAEVIFFGGDDSFDYQLSTHIFYTYNKNDGWTFNKRGFGAAENVIRSLAKK